MSVKRTRWEGNEIILTSDMNNNSDSIVKNIDTWSEFIGDNTIITGMVVSELAVPAMAVQISKGVARDDTEGKYLTGEAISTVTIPAADGVSARRDIIEVRQLVEDITPGSRQIKDPVSGNVSVVSIDTEQEYKTEVKVLSGTPGSGVAVAVEPGWLKIAEILVPAASSTVVNANIYNVDAVVSGGTNTNWTDDETAIYRNGSNSEVKTEIFVKGVPEHSNTVPYEEFTSFVQDEGMVWGSILAANLGNKPSTNQDKWIPAYAPKKTETVSTGGTFTLGYYHHTFIMDTSLGDLSRSLPDGLFDGQEVEIICDGTGIARVKGAGTLTNGKKSGIWDAADASGTPISDELSLKARWNSTVGRWQVVNEVTADYVTGAWLVRLKSDGYCIQSISISGVANSSTVQHYGTSSGTTYVYTESSQLFPIPYAFTPKTKLGYTSDQTRLSQCSQTATGTGTINTFAGGAAGQTVKADYEFEEKY